MSAGQRTWRCALCGFRSGAGKRLIAHVVGKHTLPPVRYGRTGKPP